MTTRLTRFSRSYALALAQTSCTVLALAALTQPAPAAAFCGFYVTGADSNLYANATMTVLMREGTRTVLSMQNNYQGPPESFALVIPVPIVLQKENVKVLPKDVFQRVDTLGAPRLVEYWEVDPCQVRPRTGAGGSFAASGPQASASASAGSSAMVPAVRVEAQFTVGEYDVVVLSADDSSALDTWLRGNNYNIPDGAGPVLAPYVAAGMKFFVAKVDAARVTFQAGQAALSPLRFHYDTPDFSLPVRLGLLNSQGSQDLIVNILAKQRYEVANYPNATIPTNIRVQNEVRSDFASFYEALFARALAKNSNAVVTEYAWASSSCDPCPTPPLTPQDILTLGGDVLQTSGSAAAPGANPGFPPAFTLTRLHARYTKDMLGEDLVFRTAPGIIGGRGIPDTKGKLDQAVMPQQGDWSNFQGRYVILHAWEGALACATPQRGLWGGPSGQTGTAPMTQAPVNRALIGSAPVAGDLTALLAESVPSLSVEAKTPLDPLKPAAAVSGAPATAGKPAAGSGSGSAGQVSAAAGTTATAPNANISKKSGCAVASGDDNGVAWAGLLGVAWLARRRSRRSGAAR